MDKLNREMDIQESYWNVCEALEKPLKKLLEYYGEIIRTVSVSSYMPSITFQNDKQMPDDFYTTCEKIGLVIKDVKENSSYSLKSRFYMRVQFDAYASTGVCKPEW